MGGPHAAFGRSALAKPKCAHCAFAPQGSAGDVLIRNVQLQHSGRYVCVVQSGVDRVSSAADLVVRGSRPRAPLTVSRLTRASPVRESPGRGVWEPGGSDTDSSPENVAPSGRVRVQRNSTLSAALTVSR